MRSGNAVASDRTDDPACPPGTVRLERLLGHDHAKAGIILQPRPTSDPNDPLNWPRWRKHLNFGLATFYALMTFAQFNATTPTWGPMEEELGFSAVLMYGDCTQALSAVVRPNALLADSATGTTPTPLGAPHSPSAASC